MDFRCRSVFRRVMAFSHADQYEMPPRKARSRSENVDTEGIKCGLSSFGHVTLKILIF